jgi:hypothetical protein
VNGELDPMSRTLALIGVILHSNWLRRHINTVAFSPQANYIDRASAACMQSYCHLLRIEGCRVLSATDSHGS